MKTTIKDVFLYLGLIVILYAMTISLSNLIFGIININFPLDAGYNPGPESLISPISFFIVLAPLFLIISVFINRHHEKNPESLKTWVRRFALALTIFLTVATFVVTLIILLNYFLGGDITLRFILKVITILIISGAFFAYYLRDIKRKVQKTCRKKAGWFFGIISLAVIICSLMTVGSPEIRRQEARDQERINDLMNITRNIQEYALSNNVLPESLEAINENKSVDVDIFPFEIPTDPKTKKEYEYKVIDSQALSYLLCANFELDIPENEKRYGSKWLYKQGRTCFEERVIISDKEIILKRNGEI